MKNFKSKFQKKCVEYLAEQRSLGQNIGVGVSGGPDSVFLLLVSLHLYDADKIYVLHYNHKVREVADEEECFVENLAKKFSLKFVSGKRDVEGEYFSEDSLRTMRLNFFQACQEKHNLSCILQGHHKIDIAETLIMRLLRGSSPDGLSSPKDISKYKQMTFLRPLLNFKKVEIEKYLNEIGQEFKIDKTNFETKYFRNKVRNKVLPLLEEISEFDIYESAYRTRRLCQEDGEFIDEIFKENVKFENAMASLSDFALKHKSLIRRALMGVLINADKLEALRAKGVESFVDKVAQDKLKSFKMSLENSFVCFDARDKQIYIEENLAVFKQALELGDNLLPNSVCVRLEIQNLNSEIIKEIKSGNCDDFSEVYLSLGKLKGTQLFARNVAVGDKYKNINGHIKGVAEMFTNKKFSTLKRNKSFVVYKKESSQEEILWVRGLSLNADFKIDNDTQTLKISII